jgi:hypothetical protein
VGRVHRTATPPDADHTIPAAGGMTFFPPNLVQFVDDLLDEWADQLRWQIPGLDYIPDPEAPSTDTLIAERRAAWQTLKNGFGL